MRFFRRFCLGTTLALLAVVQTDAAAAQPSGAGEGGGPALCRDDPGRETSSLTFLACRLRDGLPKLGSSTVVVSRIPDQTSQTGGMAFAERLTQFLSSATGARDGGALESHAPPPTSGPAETPLLLLEPRFRGSLVEVDATLLGKRANVWARAKGETHTVLAHAFASRPLDAELRSYLPPTPLVRPTARVFPAPFDDINAMACGDIDRDGQVDVAVASRRFIALGYLSETEFVVLHRTTPGELSEVAPVPLRQPLASLWFNGPTLEISNTDRRYWTAVDPQLQLVSRQPNLWGAGPGWCTTRADAPPQARPFDCQTPPPRTPEATTPMLDRQVALSLAAAAVPTFAWRDAASGTVVVEAGQQRLRIPLRGAQLALDDLNRDGVLEVISTSASLTRAEDAIVVYSLPQGSNEPVAAWEFPVPTGVDALAVCPLEGVTQHPVIYASANQVGVLL